jgi:hypothetical protein
MMKELIKYYSAGRRAFQNDLPLSANPYRELKRKAWRLGYKGWPMKYINKRV